MNVVRGTATHRLIALLAALFMSLSLVPQALAQGEYGLTLVKTDGVGEQQGTPVPGVAFQINRVEGIPLDSQAALNDLVKRDVRVLTDESPYAMGPSIYATTDAQGAATFSNLEAGVYLVRELPYRIGNTDYIAATPLLISVPEFGSTERDRKIRPKNQPLPVAKQTDKFCVTENDLALFTITTGIPEPDKNGKLHQYAIVDPLDERLGYHGNLTVEIIGHKPQTLTKGADYTEEFDATSRSVIVQLTEAGLAKLADARSGHPETYVVTKFNSTVNQFAGVGEVIPNKAYLIPDGWGFDLKSHVYKPITFGEAIGDQIVPALGGSARPAFVFASRRIVLAEMPLPNNVVPDPNKLDAVAIPSNPVYVCRCYPGQPSPELPGMPGGPLIPLLIGLGIAGSSHGSSELSSGSNSHPSGAPQVSEGTGQEIKKILSKGLASTGANVLWIAVLAAFLALVGWLLVGRRRRDEDGGDE